MSATIARDGAEGERRKLSAHALLAARRELFVLRGRRALLAALLDHGEATADRTAAIDWLIAHPDRPIPAECGAGGPEQTLFD